MQPVPNSVYHSATQYSLPTTQLQERKYVSHPQRMQPGLQRKPHYVPPRQGYFDRTRHTKRHKYSNNQNHALWRNDIVCHFCGEVGHVKAKCRHQSPIQCVTCANLGHKSKDCPFQ